MYDFHDNIKLSFNLYYEIFKLFKLFALVLDDKNLDLFNIVISENYIITFVFKTIDNNRN